MGINRLKQTIQSGFTLVELLIVIVVIAIIATIVVVAYNGITNSGYNTAVRTDLLSLSKQVKFFHEDNDSYPNNSSELTSLGIRMAKNSYSTASANNAIYCYNNTGTRWGIMARSKSGQRLYISNTMTDVASTNMTYTSGNDICPAIGINEGTVGWLWLYASGTWNSAVSG